MQTKVYLLLAISLFLLAGIFTEMILNGTYIIVLVMAGVLAGIILYVIAKQLALLVQASHLVIEKPKERKM